MKLRKLKPVALATLAACVAISCNIPGNDVTYSNEIIEALYVVPATALDATKKGEVDANSFNYASLDAYLNNTYLMSGTGAFSLVAYNSAPKNVTDLALVDGKLQVLDNINDLADAKLIISAKDITKIQSLTINGNIIPLNTFTFGEPSLPNGEEIKAGNRFPTDFTIMTMGTLKAQEPVNLDVHLVGECGATIHLDIAGKAYCEKTLVTSPFGGTTLTLNGPECDILDCDKTPTDPRCLPDCEITPLDPRCEMDCIDHPEDPRCHEGPGCTRTIGFWKTHSGCPTTYPNKLATVGTEETKCHDECNTPDLITSLLPIWLGTAHGPRSIHVTTNTIGIRILEQNFYGTPSNGITKLYAQLLAAKVNIADGANDTAILGVIQAADLFLANHNYADWSTLSTDQSNNVNAWHTALDNYNNGLMGPGHCE